MTTVSGPERPLIPLGVHFHLDNDAYHEDPAIGSTDIRRLLRTPQDYWWNSWMNPLKASMAEKDRKTTSAKLIGSAAHACVLEGEDVFRRRYAPAVFPGNVKAGIEERKEIVASGRIPIPEDDWNAIMVAGAMIRKNPALEDAFHGGYPEVSVFWEEGGIRFKCRFDYLKQFAVTDLKSIRNVHGEDFVSLCRKRISSYRYDMQAAHYINGRRQMSALVQEGSVYFWARAEADAEAGPMLIDGPENEAFAGIDMNWLREVADVDLDADGSDPDKPAFGFVFVFWQAEEAPVSWGCKLSARNPVVEYAADHVKVALDNYRSFLGRFGTDEAWIVVEPVEELDVSELPAWHGR